MGVKPTLKNLKNSRFAAASLQRALANVCILDVSL
ncbi:hypothetical protein A2U01_0102237 [Trifolium medium]|uniref:Uncharacterized protein n=1 Tax=Trifolium medium TaxID=97028 RepID=A0A392V1X8_9FABA|nr:hypothetical protein [Trifolium medium]